ncbi:hypothetical protein WMF38_57350 [Sorangium sp. So ce118]
MGPATFRVRADEVRVDDMIAVRNSCGGFVEWLRVTKTLDGRTIACATGGYFPSERGGAYVVATEDEMVEIAQ